MTLLSALWIDDHKRLDLVRRMLELRQIESPIRTKVSSDPSGNLACFTNQPNLVHQTPEHQSASSCLFSIGTLNPTSFLRTGRQLSSQRLTQPVDAYCQVVGVSQLIFVYFTSKPVISNEVRLDW